MQEGTADAPTADTDEDTAAEAVQSPPAPTQRVRVMLLGSGELSRELVLAFQRLGAEVIAVDRYADAPAHDAADQALVLKMTDPDELSDAIGRLRPKYVVVDTNAVAIDALRAVAESGFTQVVPSVRAAQLSLDREGMRRLAADELGLPTAPFWFAGSVAELTAVAGHAGFPLVVKPVIGVPGQGQSVLLRPEDVEPSWQRAVAAGSRVPHNRVLAETVVEIDYAVTLLTVRSDGPSGPSLHFCEPIGHRQVDGDVLESWQPQQMSEAALGAAKSVAARIVRALGGRGVFGVELLVRGDEVYFSDVSVRPYDSGLVTLRTQRLSEFELHARAVLGLPVDTILVSPGAAEVTYSGAESADEANGRHGGRTDPGAVLAEVLAVAESDVRLFGHHEGSSRRRLGLALATAPDVMAARDRVRRASTALRKLWQP